MFLIVALACACTDWCIMLCKQVLLSTHAFIQSEFPVCRKADIRAGFTRELTRSVTTSDIRGMRLSGNTRLSTKSVNIYLCQWNIVKECYLNLYRDAESGSAHWSWYRNAHFPWAAVAERGEAVVHAGVSSSNAGGVPHTESSVPAWCADRALAARPEGVVAGVHTSITSSHTGLSLGPWEGADSDN